MIRVGQQPRWIKGGRVIDPAQGIDAQMDLELFDGRVVALHPAGSSPSGEGVVDATGLLSTRAIDIHVHFVSQGRNKEDLLTGSRAAAAGGFTSVVYMPSTDPAVDRRRWCRCCVDAARVGMCDIRVCGAIGSGLSGERLADLGEMAAAGRWRLVMTTCR